MATLKPYLAALCSEIAVCAVCDDAVKRRHPRRRTRIPTLLDIPPEEQHCKHLRAWSRELQTKGEVTPGMRGRLHYYVVAPNQGTKRSA